MKLKEQVSSGALGPAGSAPAGSYILMVFAAGIHFVERLVEALSSYTGKGVAHGSADPVRRIEEPPGARH